MRRLTICLLFMMMALSFSGMAAAASYADYFHGIVAEHSGIEMPGTAYQFLQANEAKIFGGTDPYSLDSVAKKVINQDVKSNYLDYATTVISKSELTIQKAQYVNYENGRKLTIAMAKSGNQSPTYYQILYYGSQTIPEGSGYTANGIIVGQTEVTLTNALGQQWNEPMYVIVAGNIYTTLSKWADQKSAVDKQRQEERKEQIKNNANGEEYVLRLRDGSNAEDFWLVNEGKMPITIKSIQVGKYVIQPNATLDTLQKYHFNAATFGMNYYSWVASTSGGDAKIIVETDAGNYVKEGYNSLKKAK